MICKIEIISKQARKFFKNYNMATDKNIFIVLMEMFYNNVPEEYHPEIFIEVQADKFSMESEIYEFVKPSYNGDFKPLADYIYSSSILTDKDRRELFRFLQVDPLGVLQLKAVANRRPNHVELLFFV